MAKIEIELISVRFENVRGFYDATLPLENEKMLLVGRNHAGKTSAFLLLEWLINRADPHRLYDRDTLTEAEQQLILPARSARHRARRITLSVYIPDGRTGRKYEANEYNIALLRVGFRVSGPPVAFIQLGPASRTSGDVSTERARELLEWVQSTYSVLHVPSARDATSSQFRDRFRELFKNRLSERALHPGTASGSTSEYREVVRTTVILKELAESLLEPALERLASSLPAGMLRAPNLSFKAEIAQSVVDWLVDQVSLKLVTGDHDDIGVSPTDVGAGLQSVLDIAVASVILDDPATSKHLLVAIEEPEAFLHPSLQRTIARKLLSKPYGHKTLISTHSTVLVEEARYDQIVLAVDRTFQEPKAEEDENQSAIHTAHLTGPGAEIVFARSVLLVEGPGDRAFFEGLRRRLAERDNTGLVENMFVLPVGGKASFGPWIRLLRALNGGTESGPLSYLLAPDGDATSAVQTALNQSGISLPQRARELLQRARICYADGDFPGWRERIIEANEQLSGVPVCFMEGDLEYAMLSGVTAQRVAKWARSLSVEFENKEAFIKRMGSKAIDGSGGAANKQPYMRRQIADWIPLSSLSRSITNIMLRWLVNAGFNDEDSRALFDDS